MRLSLRLPVLVYVALLPSITSAITSSFVSGDEGWSVVDLTFPTVGAPPPVLATYTPMWSASGGNPGGHLSMDDPSVHVFYWSAPSSYLGNQSTYYAGNLSFDLRYVLGSSPIDQEDVVLVGGGRTLVFNTAPLPDSTWRNYSVGLSETGWRLNSLTGPAASQADMQAALESLEALYIRGEYRNDLNDIGSLDNVRLLRQVAGPVSTFDVNDEGWRVADLPAPTISSPPTILGTYTPVWSASDGNPGGHLFMEDPGANVFYWSAPDSFLGDQSASYGASLSFDLRHILGTSVFSQEDVVLVGAGMTLVFDTSPVPDDTWHSFSVGLTELGWLLDSLSGTAATQADMQAVLGSLEGLYIRGEYRGGLNDVGSIDNVRLFRLDDPSLLPGDYNNDGFVNAADYVVWRNNFGAPSGTLPNDINGGMIGTPQYETWRVHYGESSSAVTAAAASSTHSAVPEPTALLLLTGVVVLTYLPRRLPGPRPSDSE